jgi:hypothetical protein
MFEEKDQLFARIMASKVSWKGFRLFLKKIVKMKKNIYQIIHKVIHKKRLFLILFHSKRKHLRKTIS